MSTTARAAAAGSGTPRSKKSSSFTATSARPTPPTRRAAPRPLRWGPLPESRAAVASPQTRRQPPRRPLPHPLTRHRRKCNRKCAPRLAFASLQSTPENYRKLWEIHRRFMKILVGLPFRGARRAPLVLLQAGPRSRTPSVRWRAVPARMAFMSLHFYVLHLVRYTSYSVT